MALPALEFPQSVAASWSQRTIAASFLFLQVKIGTVPFQRQLEPALARSVMISLLPPK
jgi:hypothetical protein